MAPRRVTKRARKNKRAYAKYTRKIRGGRMLGKCENGISGECPDAPRDGVKHLFQKGRNGITLCEYCYGVKHK